MANDVDIEAAGGVIWRDHEGVVEVIVVHRPRYDDWSFPKGKLEPGERPLDGARREVREETGFDCEPGAKLSSTRYRDRKGRAKRVRYWAMQVRRGSFRPNHEVDALRWLPVHAAGEQLTYPHDLALLRELDALLTRH